MLKDGGEDEMPVAAPHLIKGYIICEQLRNRKHKLLYIITALERNHAPGSLRPLQLVPSEIDQFSKKLEWRQRQLQLIKDINPAFLSNVNLLPLLVVVHAAEKLESLLSALPDRMFCNLLFNAEEGDIEWTLKARDEDSLTRAKKAIADAIADAEKCTSVGFLTLPDRSAFPRIVGTKGANVARLRAETGAEITVSRENNTIVIIGEYIP